MGIGQPQLDRLLYKNEIIEGEFDGRWQSISNVDLTDLAQRQDLELGIRFVQNSHAHVATISYVGGGESPWQVTCGNVVYDCRLVSASPFALGEHFIFKVLNGGDITGQIDRISCRQKTITTSLPMQTLTHRTRQDLAGAAGDVMDTKPDIDIAAVVGRRHR